VKAFRLFTYHPTPPSELWPDLRAALPPEQASKPRLYARDLPRELVAEALRRFAAALEPLGALGRLGDVVFQLPRYVYPSRGSFGYLDWVAGELPALQVSVEFQQHRWMDQEHRERTLDFLDRHGLAYVCVDEPQGFPSSVPPVAVAIADWAEVRFHGRNAETWEARDVRPVERFAYDYPPDELAEWVLRIRLLHQGGRPVHLLMNNVFGGYAVRSARTLARLLADDLDDALARRPGVPRSDRVPTADGRAAGSGERVARMARPARQQPPARDRAWAGLVPPEYPVVGRLSGYRA
jgi:uncharacterized protein YecE (DUF72 family)